MSEEPRRVLIILECPTTAMVLQRLMPANVMVRSFGSSLLGVGRVDAIFLRWPSREWKNKRAKADAEIQDWVLNNLRARLARDGDFNHI